MKRLIMHSILAAAALGAVAGIASAQSVTAEIPFAFRASHTLLQPGSYDLARIRTASAVVFSLRSRDNGASVFLMNYGGHDPDQGGVKAGAAKLGFTCSEGHCALQELWTAEGSSYRFVVAKHDRGEAREIALTRSPRN